MRASLKFKLMTGLIASITIMAVAIFLIVTMNVKAQSMEAFTRDAAGELKQADNAIALFLEENQHTALYVASHPAMARLDDSLSSYLGATADSAPEPLADDALGREIWEFLKPVWKSRPYYATVYVGTKHGGFIKAGASPIRAGYDPRARPWYKEALARPGETTVSKAYLSTNGEPSITISQPIKGTGGDVTGIVGLDISLASLTELLKSIKIGHSGHVLFIEKGGVILANPKNPATNFKKIEDLKDAGLDQMNALASGALEFTRDGVDYVAYVHASPKLGHKLVGVMEKSEMMAPVIATLQQVGLVIIACLAAITAFVWWFVQSTVIRALGRVGEFLNAVSDRDYDRRIESRRRDEIGVIYARLNGMAARLRENIEEITRKGQTAETLAAEAQLACLDADAARNQAVTAKADGMLQAAHSLESVVQVVSSAAEELSSMSEQISKGAALQAERVGATATAMEQMNVTVLEVARNSSDAAVLGQQAKEKAASGSAIVADSLQAMQTTYRQAETLQGNMSQLDKQAQAIGAIMTVIEDIADQTNLLALNAAIEAARAGDAGRGFAVVADEVRKLAEKTMGATKEVGQSIRAIQTVASENISSMGLALTDLNQALTLVEQSGGVLKDIVRSVEVSADQIRSIATAAEEQSASAGEIAQAVEQINQITMETSLEAANSSHAARELGGQVKALLRIIEQLKRSGEDA